MKASGTAPARWRIAARALAAAAACLALVAGSISVGQASTADAATKVAALPGWLHTAGASIKTSSNKTYVIKAVAWFGMETSNCAPHGLWTISLDSGLATIKSMGFNTIRLPYSTECLAASSTNSIDAAKNPTLVSKTPLQLMDTVIKRAKAHGLNVILDRHRPDSAAQSTLWYTSQYSEARWISDWKKLAKRYRSQSNVIGFDLQNEPHGTACWGCGDRKLDWRAAATRAGNAVLTINPKLLIIVEGIEQQSTAGSEAFYWWGGGLAAAGKKPVTLAVKHRVVYSPHDYPSSIYQQSWFTAANYPANLPGVWTRNWGYLDTKNIAPVLLGEFGTKLETTSDKQWLSTMVAYLKKNKMSFAYWSFNPNSGDTGGLVTDDWTTKETAKLRYLAPLLGKGTSVVVVPGTTSGTTGTAAGGTESGGTSTDAGSSAVPTAGWSLQSSWDTGYVAQLQVSSASAIDGWTVSWPDTTATSIASSWGMSCTLTPGVSISCTGTDWARSIAAGSTATVGLQVNATAAPQSPVLTTTH